MKVSALVLVLAIGGREPLAASLIAASPQGAPIAEVPQQRADDPPPGVPTTPVEPRGALPPPTSPNRTGGRGAAAVPPPSSTAPASTPAANTPTVTPAPAAPNSIQVNPVVQPATPVAPVNWWQWVWLYLLLKVISLPALVFLWMRRRRARARSDTPAVEPPPAPWLAPRITFVPRLDAGRQSVTIIDARGGRTFELAYHMDPGTQHVSDHEERIGAAS